MSIEDGGKKYSAEELNAHEEANMLSADIEPRLENGDMPSIQDYDEALSRLEKLQEEVSHESPSFDGKVARSMKDVMAGFVTVGGNVIELIGRAIASGAMAINPSTSGKQEWKQLIEEINKMPEDYKMIREELESAHETLEKWKKEVEEFAKRQNETIK